jgi:PAS domain S-box-containing protein
MNTPQPVSPDLVGGNAGSGRVISGRMEEILNRMSDAFIAMDRDWRITYVNPAYLKLVSPLYSNVEDLVGHILWERFPDIDPEAIRRFQTAMELQQPDHLEDYYEPLDRWLEVRVHPGPESVAFYMQDITLRKKAEATLRDSEERYRTLFTTLDDGFCVFEMIYDEAGRPVDYRFTEVNEAFERHTGLKDVVAKTIKELVPCHEEHWFEIYGHIAKTGEPQKFTHVGAGMNRWFEVSAFRMGPPEARKVAAIFADVTQRYLTEKALRESEERYRNLFTSIDEGVGLCEMLYDANGKAIDYRILEVNPAFTKNTGLTPESVVGKTARELMLAPEERIARYAEVLATGEPLRYQYYVEPIGRWLDVFVSRVGGDGSPFFVPVFNDITARMESEKVLKAAKETAEAANAAKDKFLAVLSHELRTPLTPVLMTAAARELDPDISPALREDMSMIRRNVELETKLIDDLLDLSRITSGKLALRMEALELNTLVRHVCSICRPQMQEKEVQLHMDFDPEAGRVMADPARLQQILWNILRNAAKFTPDGGEIVVATRRSSPERVVVQITDSGIGISPEVLPNIFEAFEQGDSQITRKFGGMGLGLSISKALTALHGGTISVTSEGQGRGSMFTLELPSHPEETSEGLSSSSPQAESGNGEIRVLLVEDHADTARVLAMLLRRAGYEVDPADSVAAAIRLASAHRYDLLVSDLGLPDGSGYEVMKRLREKGPMKGIAMSGYGMDEDIRRSFEAGFSEHVVKPVNGAHLQAVMRRVLQQV